MSSQLAPSAVQLAAYNEHVISLTRRWAWLTDLLGARVVLALLACTGAASCPRWWLAPDWPYLVEEFIARLADPRRWGSPMSAAYVNQFTVPADVADLSELHRLLLTDPDRLSTASARFCLKAGLGHLLPQHYRRPPRRRRAVPDSYRALVDPRP